MTRFRLWLDGLPWRLRGEWPILLGLVLMAAVCAAGALTTADLRARALAIEPAPRPPCCARDATLGWQGFWCVGYPLFYDIQVSYGETVAIEDQQAGCTGVSFTSPGIVAISDGQNPPELVDVPEGTRIWWCDEDIWICLPVQ